MRDIVAFQQLGKNSTSAERIWLKCDENQDRWGEGMVCTLKMEVEGRDEGPW
jgi:hypothetical protein